MDEVKGKTATGATHAGKAFSVYRWNPLAECTSCTPAVQRLA